MHLFLEVPWDMTVYSALYECCIEINVTFFGIMRNRWTSIVNNAGLSVIKQNGMNDAYFPPIFTLANSNILPREQVNCEGMD